MTEAGPDDRFLKVLQERLALIALAPSPAGPEAQALLPLWPPSSPSQRVEPAKLPACDYLAEALELGVAGPESAIATGLPQLTQRFHWTYGYPRDSRYPGLERHVAFTEVLGTTGIWSSQRMLLWLHSDRSAHALSGARPSGHRALSGDSRRGHMGSRRCAS